MIERVGDIVVVKLPKDICFYESKALTTIDKLGNLAEELHKTNGGKIKGVLLLQEGTASDWHRDWVAELAETCMFNDLVYRIDTWRWVLSLIRNSPIAWTYAAAADCRGSSWELALCCQHRYWFKANALLGFPEINIGVFPPGGVLESLNKRTGRTRERWQSSPFCTASEALDDGLIDFCSEAIDWQVEATSIFADILALSPNSGVREQRRKRAKNDFISVDSQSRRAAYEEIENVWRQEKFGVASGPTAWDYCWQLVKERAKLKNPGDLGRLISLIASRYLLSPAYLIWLQSRQVAHARSGALSTKRSCLLPIVIDLSQAAPPNSILVRLLQAPIQIIFAATDGRDLVAALNLQFSRLESALGNIAAQYLWERGVTWYQGQAKNSHSTVLSWTHDDCFTITINSSDYRFLRLDGNAPMAEPGLMEFFGIDDHLPTSAQAIVELVSDGLLRTQANSTEIPLTAQIRSIFLDEMLRISQYTDGDLTTVASHLKNSGWRFAGDGECWDRFLRTRHSSLSSTKGETTGSWLPTYNSDITTWRFAKVQAKRSNTVAETRWNETAVSQHFALFLGRLAELTLTQDIRRDRSATDFLCASALGLPNNYGTPLTFLSQRGKRRVEHYTAIHWPHFQLTGNSNHGDIKT